MNMNRLKKRLCRLNTIFRFRYSYRTCKNRFVCRESHLYSWETEKENVCKFVMAGGVNEVEQRVMHVMGE